METNATIVYDTESAKKFIDNISSKNRAPETNHLSYKIETYTDQTQKISALEEADIFMKSALSKQPNNNYGTIKDLDSREATAKASVSYNNYTLTKNNSGLMDSSGLSPNKKEFTDQLSEVNSAATKDFYDEEKAMSKRVTSSNQKAHSSKEIVDILKLMQDSLTKNDTEGGENKPLQSNLEFAKTLLTTIKLKVKDENAKLSDDQYKILAAYSNLQNDPTYGDGFESLTKEIADYIANTSKYQEAKALNESFLKTLSNGSLAGYTPYNGASQATLLSAGTIKNASGDSSKGMTPKDGPGKKFLQEVDSLYKTNLKYVKYENAYIKSGVEHSLTAYWNIEASKSDLLLGCLQMTPPVILGVSKIATAYASALNKQNGENYYLISDTVSSLKSNYKSIASTFTHEPNPMPVPAIELKAENGAIVFKNHFPNAFMGTSTLSRHGNGGQTVGIQTTADMVGFNSVQEFLLAGSDFVENTHKKYNIIKSQYNSPAKTDSEFDDKRRKYFNESIRLLAESMPDFSPNMFDVILTVGNEKPISLFSDDKTLRKQLLYSHNHVIPIQGRKKVSEITFKTGQEDIDFDSREYKDRLVNARTLAMRCTGLTLPGIESSTYDIQWGNHTITKPGSRSNRNYTSSMNIRLDMPLFFADAFLELAGQYSTVKFQDPIRFNYYFNHYYFHKAGGGKITGDGGSNLELNSNDTRINLYVPIFDFHNVQNNPNASSSNPIAGLGNGAVGEVLNKLGAQKMTYNPYGWPNDYEDGERWHHDTKIPATTVYCFEDVRFLGADSLSFTSGGGDAPMSMPVEFTFRRFYKFLWNMNAKW